jgi:hypothetical protein
VQAGVDALVPRAPRALNESSKGGGSSGGVTNVTFQVSLPNVKDGKEAAEALASESFQAQFTRMIERFNAGQGLATQSAPGGIT